MLGCESSLRAVQLSVQARFDGGQRGIKAARTGAPKQLRRPLCYRNSVAETFLLRAVRVFPSLKQFRLSRISSDTKSKIN